MLPYELQGTVKKFKGDQNLKDYALTLNANDYLCLANMLML
jgi:hypothetical protein